MIRRAAVDAIDDDGGGRLGRSRNDDLLDDRYRLADDGSERPPQAAIVGRARAEPESDGHGDGKEPERQAGDDRADPDEPQRRRDEIEEDQDPDADLSLAMDPLVPEYRGA